MIIYPQAPTRCHRLTASVDNTGRIWSADAAADLILKGHTRSVVFAAFDGNGERVVTGSLDRTARLWNARDGRLLQVFRGSTGAVDFAAFSPDGRQLITASMTDDDPNIRLWNTQTGDIVAAVDCGQSVRLCDPQFISNGSQCLTVGIHGDAQTADVWDVLSRKPIAALVGHRAGVTSAQITSDGTLAATGSFDKTARIWDLSSQQELLRIDDPDAILTEQVLLSADGSRLLTSGGKGIWTMRDLTGGAMLASLPGEALASSAKSLIMKDTQGNLDLTDIVVSAPPTPSPRR